MPGWRNSYPAKKAADISGFFFADCVPPDEQGLLFCRFPLRPLRIIFLSPA